MPSLTRDIPHDSDISRRILAEVKYRIQSTNKDVGERHKKWKEAEDRALAFIPERDVDKARRTDRDNGLPVYTTIQIPYSYAVLMSAHTYLTSVFMGRSPVFQYSGRHGEGEQQIQAMEALVDYQTTVGYALPSLYTWLYDAGKYGAGIVGLWWDTKIDYVSYIVAQPKVDMMGNQVGEEKRQITAAIPKYKGNRIYNVQPWDFLWDTRFPLAQFQKGEYCGVRRVLSWNDLLRRKAQGYYINLDKLPMRGMRGNFLQGSGEDMGSSALIRPESTDPNILSYERDMGIQGKHPVIVGIYEMYVELIPKEWSLGASEYPEKWVFTVNDDVTVLLGCQPHGAFHCMYPFSVLSLEPEGYGLVTRGIPELLEPVQNTVDWLVNSHFFNVRAVLNNKLIVDPSRLVMKDVLDPLPGGVVRMKPEAYGTDAKTTYSQLTVTDVTQNHLRDIQLMFGMGERTVGVNDQIMGLLQSGGRKTATEVRTSTSFGVNRLKTVSEYFSAVGFDPLSMMMVGNSQQYYDGEQKFKIAGDLVQEAGQQFMTITPDLIAGSYTFVPVDGTLPIDRYAQANLWKELMAGMRNFPEIGLQYDMARIFEWVAKLAGLKNITQFRSQIAPDQNLLMQAKLGNVVPLTGRGAGGKSPSAKPAMNPQEPAQIPGMGPTG